MECETEGEKLLTDGKIITRFDFQTFSIIINNKLNYALNIRLIIRFEVESI